MLYEHGSSSGWTNMFVSFVGFFKTKNHCSGCVVLGLYYSLPSHSTQTSALDILMSLLKHLSTSLSKSSRQPQFHVPHFKKVIDALLTCPPSGRGGKKRSVQGELNAEVRDQFVMKWLNVYVDVRWFFLRDAEYDFCLISVFRPRLTKLLS